MTRVGPSRMLNYASIEVLEDIRPSVVASLDCVDASDAVVIRVRPLISDFLVGDEGLRNGTAFNDKEHDQTGTDHDEDHSNCNDGYPSSSVRTVREHGNLIWE